MNPAIRRRDLDRELLLQLDFAVAFRGVREVAVRVVALARFDFRIRLVPKPDRDAPVPSVLFRVRAGEAEDVVRRDVFCDLAERLAEVVRVEECRAAGVGGQRRRRLLLRRAASAVNCCPTAEPVNTLSPPRLP
jgi:hypothetical protein